MRSFATGLSDHDTGAWCGRYDGSVPAALMILCTALAVTSRSNTSMIWEAEYPRIAKS